MFSWVKNIAINYAVKLIKAELDKVEATNPDIRDFRYNLYKSSTASFMAWGMHKLEEGSDTLTPIQLIKKRIAPLNDDVEGVIVKVLDGLAP
jgi:hypothetical protein